MHRARHRAEVLASIVNSSEDAIIGKTLGGTITSWNAGAERLYGYTAAEAVGRNVSMLVPPAHGDELPQIAQRLARGEHVEPFETARVTKDGRTIHVSLTVSPVKDAQGQIIGASKIARDITERKRAEAALRQSEERNQALLDALPDLLIDVLPVLERAGQHLVRDAVQKMAGDVRDEALTSLVVEYLADHCAGLPVIVVVGPEHVGDQLHVGQQQRGHDVAVPVRRRGAFVHRCQGSLYIGRCQGYLYKYGLIGQRPGIRSGMHALENLAQRGLEDRRLESGVELAGVVELV